jgi:hypothetical protein
MPEAQFPGMAALGSSVNSGNPPLGTQNLERNVPFGGCAINYRVF